MHPGDPLSVSTPTDQSVVIERSFAAPPHLVYACYTQPGLIRRWLTGPDGWTMPVCSYDARPGGDYRFEWRGPEEGFLALTGKIDSIDAIRYIDSTEQFDAGAMGPSYRSELAFTLKDMGTLVVNTLTYASLAHRDMVVATGMAEGMEQSFQSLDRLLASQQA
ncbi:MAG: SRPBCC domain-containing protein [Devosia sp.]|uniref:SRPBCC domain-containing protein n=1 Tax=Devosia sp. TaxID=1871048 RepID=UPI0024C7FFFD|nr:SRPBCC domain-containing protein [Devosia sp.]UYO00656.1 MAG: SRPBCC domain-containing protein [Devosia sp.]